MKNVVLVAPYFGGTMVHAMRCFAALEDVPSTDRAREHNDIWLPWLTRELEKLGLRVNPSVGNFVLVRFPDEKAKNADAAWTHLQQNGVLVRKMGGL